jgi:hypothetical protein
MTVSVAGEWTERSGIVRGVLTGGAVALLLGLLADVLAWYAPVLVLNGWLRIFGSLLTMWFLFIVVHRAVGMTGPICTGLVVLLVLAIAVSQHVVFALHGVPTREGLASGWAWCSPAVLMWCNLTTLGGVAFGVFMWKDGADLRGLTDMLGARIRG